MGDSKWQWEWMGDHESEWVIVNECTGSKWVTVNDNESKLVTVRVKSERKWV